ncbi:putative abhydrolase domain-containing protein [Abeliophyllum distichum]|uniref:Abhydrolase domain-containing protein n=1 Tax=Abeliophyllum distichum TaxID=126358 RepID=A0ABD1RU08_9LAMI
MRLPLHLMFRRILRSYGLAPTQVVPNGWSQMVGGMYLWFRYSFGMNMPLYVFQTIYQPRNLPKKEGQGGRSRVRVYDDPEPDLDVPSFCGMANILPRCELSKDVVDIVGSIYQAAPLTRSYGLILNGHHSLVELGLMASEGPRFLVPGSAGDTLQKKVIEDLSWEENRTEVAAPDAVEIEDSGVPEGEVPLKRKKKCWASRSGPSQSKKKEVEVVDNYTVCAPQPLQRTLSVNHSGEVVLDSPLRVDPVSRGSGVGLFDSRKKLKELIGPPGSRISDYTLKNVPFFPSMGAQTVKKYFTPKWEEFATLEELEDMLEAGLTAAVRAMSLQIKADLKEFDSNVLQLTKQLDNVNATQKVAIEALEVANIEKRHLQSESESRELEAQRLRRDLEASEKGRTETEAEVAQLLGEKKRWRLNSREVLAVLRAERPDLDLGPLADRFPSPRRRMKMVVRLPLSRGLLY